MENATQLERSFSHSMKNYIAFPGEIIIFTIFHFFETSWNIVICMEEIYHCSAVKFGICHHSFFTVCFMNNSRLWSLWFDLRPTQFISFHGRNLRARNRSVAKICSVYMTTFLTFREFIVWDKFPWYTIILASHEALSYISLRILYLRTSLPVLLLRNNFQTVVVIDKWYTDI